MHDPVETMTKPDRYPDIRRSLALLLLAALAAAGCSPEAPAERSTSVGEDRAPVDLIVAGDYVVAMDDDWTLIEDGAVAVADGRIVAVDTAEAVDAAYAAAERIAGDNRVVMPGLINGHTHAAMSLLRGIADDYALMDWLNNYIFPAEVAFVDAEFVRIGTELACWEMIRGGTTMFVDMYYYPDTIAAVVESCGLRAMVTTAVLDQRTPDAEGAGDALAKGIEYIKRWQGRSERITPAFGPHSNYTLKPEHLAAVRDAAQQLGVPMSIHLSESPFEVEMTRENYGTTTISMLEEMDFFAVKTIGAHVVWPQPEEIPVLVERRVGAIHNPTSNMKTAAGVSPVTEMLAAGVLMGLGTDGAASNNDLDMWEEMRLAAFLQKVEEMDPQALPAEAVLRMATSGGAEAIGMGEEIGSLEPGKRADIIQVSFDDVHFVPTYDVTSHLVYVADEQDVVTTIVEGKVLMRDREILTIDTERVTREADALAAKITAGLVERQQNR